MLHTPAYFQDMSLPPPHFTTTSPRSDEITPHIGSDMLPSLDYNRVLSEDDDSTLFDVGGDCVISHSVSDKTLFDIGNDGLLSRPKTPSTIRPFRPLQRQGGEASRAMDGGERSSTIDTFDTLIVGGNSPFSKVVALRANSVKPYTDSESSVCLGERQTCRLLDKDTFWANSSS
jgi:hypothetical protein